MCIALMIIRQTVICLRVMLAYSKRANVFVPAVVRVITSLVISTLLLAIYNTLLPTLTCRFPSLPSNHLIGNVFWSAIVVRQP